MISIEWNALTYAGHTVWNRHAPEGTGVKRRAREEWHITRNTHEALITEAEAESILAQLETSDIGRAVANAKASQSAALLTGLLYTSEGQAWVAHGRKYRLRARGKRGRIVPAEKIDLAVIAQVQADMGSDLFLRALLEAGKRHKVASDPAAALDARIAQLEREKAKAAQLALTNDADTFLQLVAERGKQIDALKREAAAIRAETSLTAQTSALTPGQLRERLAEQGPIRAIQTLVERIVLEPDLTCRLQYKALSYRTRWRSVASPEVCDRWPPDLTVKLAI